MNNCPNDSVTKISSNGDKWGLSNNEFLGSFSTDANFKEFIYEGKEYIVFKLGHKDYISANIDENFPIAKMEVNGNLFNSLQRANIKEIVEFNKTTMDEIIKPFWSRRTNRDYEIETISKFEELKNYENQIVYSGGEGYSNLFHKEISELFDNFKIYFFRATGFINKDIKNHYLNYSKSLTSDLTIVDNVVRFYNANGYKVIDFDLMFNKMINSDVFNENIIESFSKEYFSHDFPMNKKRALLRRPEDF